MSDTSPLAVATEYFEALGRGDIPAAIALLSPELVWNQPGANRFSGIHNGVDGFGAMMEGMMTVSEGSFALEVTGPAMVNGELVAVPVRFSGKRAGAEMNMSGIDLLTIRGGKIVEVHLFSEDGATEDEFWGQE